MHIDMTPRPEVAEDAAEGGPWAEHVPSVDLLARARSASWLLAQHFPPLKWVVPGVIPEGMTLLNAAPKVGKSWLVLGLAVACASGGYALGSLTVARRPVLYLALEDGDRRLQSRLRSLGVDEAPPNLWFLTQVPPGNIIATIRQFLDEHEGADPLVILDTLGRSRPPVAGNVSQYAADYSHAAALKATVDAHPGAALIVVHHTRKGGASDFLDEVSGTQGLAGAADTVAILKREREGQDAVLSITSRDAIEGSYGLRISAGGSWTLAGGDLDQARTTAATMRASAGLGDRSAEIVAEVARHPQGVGPTAIAQALGDLDASTVGTYLGRLTKAGRIVQAGRGRYVTPDAKVFQFPAPPVESVESVETHPTNSTLSTLSTAPKDVESDLDAWTTRRTPTCSHCGEPLDGPGLGRCNHDKEIPR